MADGRWMACGVASLALVLVGRAEAQPLVILPDRLVVSGSIGVSANSEGYSGDSSLDFAGAVELPLVQPFRLRFAAGRVAWRFGPPRDAAGPLARDTISLTRATISIMKTIAPPVVGGVPLAVYAGGGAGVYHYGLQRGTAAVPTRWGLHALGGIEYILPNDRFVLGGEAQLHAVGGSRRRTVRSSELLVLQASMGVKYRF
jgi:hypothetical protein